MKVFVYIVECADRSFYTGVTNSLERRVYQHNGLLGGGARYTRNRRPVKLVFARACPDRRAGLALERTIKKMTHARKAELAGMLP